MKKCKKTWGIITKVNKHISKLKQKYQCHIFINLLMPTCTFESFINVIIFGSFGPPYNERQMCKDIRHLQKTNKNKTTMLNIQACTSHPHRAVSLYRVGRCKLLIFKLAFFLPRAEMW